MKGLKFADLPIQPLLYTVIFTLQFAEFEIQDDVKSAQYVKVGGGQHRLASNNDGTNRHSM